MFVESTAISMFQMLDRVIVGFVLGPAAVGVYSVGTSIGLRMSLIAGQITELMIPYASLKNSLGEKIQLHTIFRKMSRYISILIAFIGGVLILWMRELLSIWISPTYAAQNASIFQIVTLAYCFLSLSRAGHQTLTGMGNIQFTSIVYLSSTIIMLGSLYLLARRFSLPGAALANNVMILLLAFNLFGYWLLSEPFKLKQVISDLGLGIFIPLLLTLLALAYPQLSIGFKVLITTILFAEILISLLSDDYFKQSMASLIESRQKT
jgi:O-antigen/teichoic acid export membrane protein